ncbi:MAG: hypothetical protein ACRERU_06275 [Methylococcales bacterium]
MATIMKRLIRRLSILMLDCAGLSVADEASLEAVLRQLLNGQAAAALGIKGRRMASPEISETLLKRYREQGLKPVWVTPERPGLRAGILYETLRSAPDEWLKSEDYRVGEIGSFW